MTAWLFAFLVHSTLWCAAAWVLIRMRPTLHARLRETIWTTALAASVVTPCVQFLTTSESALWRLRVPASFAVAETEHSASEQGATVMTWLDPAGGAWLACAAALLLFYVARLDRLRRRLRRRELVSDPRAAAALTSLSRRAAFESPPRLTESHSLGSPVALGFGARREICVPVRALHELDAEELSALLGHEVAHHLRRDTLRIGVLHTLQAVFFFQPLFRVAVRELHFAAEEQCDDWAASQLEDRFAMASCLTEVAGWLVRRDRNTPVPCMGRRRSHLEERVRRLLEERRATPTFSTARQRLAAVGLLGVASWFAPSVTFEGAEPDEHRAVPEHQERRGGEHDRREHSREERHHRG